MAYQIRIGGTFDRARFTAFLSALSADGEYLRPEWEEPPLETPEEFVSHLAEPDNQLHRLGRWSAAEGTRICRQHGVPYIAHSEHEALDHTISWWIPGMENEEEKDSNTNRAVLLDLDDIRDLVSNAETEGADPLTALRAYLDRATPPVLPPLRITDSPAES